MITSAIELKKKVHLGNSLNNESTYVGNVGDFLVTTKKGHQGIIPKEIYQELITSGVAIVPGGGTTNGFGILLGGTLSPNEASVRGNRDDFNSLL
jgi:hypothetical protein